MEKVSALLSLIFFKEKQDGKLKGQHYINGSAHREYILKEEAASHTVATESVFTTAAISVLKKRVHQKSLVHS